MALPLFRVRVGWEGRNAGVAVVGTAVVGDDAVGFPFTPIFSGAFDTLADDSNPAIDSVLDGYTFTRGTSGDLSSMQAGQLNLTILDLDGLYNPANPASPLAGMVKPMRPITVEVSLDGGVTWVGRFYGWITTITPDSLNRRVTIAAQDIFLWLGLNGFMPTIPSTGPTTTGAAIGLILDEMGWTNPAMRDLDVGDPIPDFTADGSIGGLQLVENLLIAEQGRFFQRGDGVVRFEDRHADALQALYATLPSSMHAISPGIDVAQVTNLQRITRTGGVQQSYSDKPSDREYGTREGNPIDTPYLMGDTTGGSYASGLARYMVQHGKEPGSTVWSLTLISSDDAMLAISQKAEIGARIAATDDVFNTDSEFFVLKITDTFTSGGAQIDTQWTLIERPTAEPAIVGSSRVGGADVVTY